MAQASFSDFSDETKPKDSILYGGTGLFSQNGLKKSCYYVYWLLGGLGSEFLVSGNRWALFRNGRCLQLVLHHACQYHLSDRNMRQGSNTDYYKISFEDTHALRLEINFNGLCEEKYFVKSWRIGSKAGSIYDKWQEMGAPMDLTPSEQRYLDNAAHPMYTRTYMSREALTHFSITLEPNDVVLIELEPQ